MKPKMPPELAYWTADEVAECLPVSNALSGKLWNILESAKKKTPQGGDGSDGTVEVPGERLGNYGDQGNNWWRRLTVAERQEVVDAWRKR